MSYSKAQIINALQQAVDREQDSRKFTDAVLLFVSPDQLRRVDVRRTVKSGLQRASDEDVQELARIFIDDRLCLSKGQFYIYNGEGYE